MPKTEEWLYWAKLRETHGPVVSVTVLGQPIVVLNTIEACQDLMEKRSSIYSGRPVLQFAGKMVGWDRQMILSEDGERHRAMRKMFARHIGTPATIREYKDMQEEETRLFLVEMAQKPEIVLTHLRSAISAMFLKITHGYAIERNRPDPLITLIEKAAHEFYLASAPGKWLVDLLPWLYHIPDWLPGAGFKRAAARFRDTNIKQVEVPIRFVKAQMAGKSAAPSFSSHVLDSKPNPLDTEVFPYVATSLYAGGQDTVTATLGTFFLAMVLYPDAQRKAQEELARVIGSSTLPTTTDFERLPYLVALFKEVMRWHTVACINLPHYTTADDTYNGYYIPKGSIILANLWLIANDPNNYSDPSVFKPERFLGEKPELDPLSYVFGFGRRRCPGVELARTICTYVMAVTLTIFDIVKARDADGKEITPPPEFYSSTVCHPKPFPCDVRPRSADAELLLKTMRSEVTEQESDAPKLDFS
ncbi:cytochrome P450 oxidoreductase [Vararia minispora EC-137]|uniref:Cytochrome P450 oxidoreductase n=1 Tax=Vararia minispora EC-137 TaxID=1314806 RepID=A0ACB8QV14_9AGAM|nr:cytochrome P450 oxidoreductase [Vararia minispora EC-137]